MIRLVLAGAAALALGCGARPEPPYVTVSGRVTRDGEPLTEGRVVFVPTDGAAPRSIPVVKGRFAGEARAGKNVVQVHALKEVPNPDREMARAEPTVGVSLVADRFGHDSRDVREVSETGPNEFEIAVSEK
ncbi:Uncharacterized protein OS=Blastopirellula marina DSM 3645 GN=DSM3645_11646 PE=4 SV=1 [Gemmataceae bacterium]|nr:Uncharacterized protein OS=Blastopirellula marina DSM 3645 GN=DSM3645_11646 PE=4 SV=1 [Gemmataceae bacterium]VTT96777.1 Uncharacterized protein OS=Blastopirellula marina DSM 3645 GN=DSM3645_11646 PE=4 SV=1 [Gemmataceae bacterium]